MKSGRYFRDFRAVSIGHFEAKIVILDVGANLRMRLRHAAELGFPIAVEHHPVDVAMLGIWFPNGRCCEVLKSNVGRRASGIVGIEQGFDGALAYRTAR